MKKLNMENTPRMYEMFFLATFLKYLIWYFINIYLNNNFHLQLIYCLLYINLIIFFLWMGKLSHVKQLALMLQSLYYNCILLSHYAWINNFAKLRRVFSFPVPFLYTNQWTKRFIRINSYPKFEQNRITLNEKAIYLI